MEKKQLVKTIALYLRLSKEDGDDEESESITNQRALIKKYIEENFIYEKCIEYIDDGYTGANFDRPGFQRMLQDIKAKKINLVITKNLSRFAREYKESGEYIEKIFVDYFVRYIAILDNVDNFKDSATNDFAPIKSVFNEMFCRETSKAVKKSKKLKMLDGFYSCNVAPYGYEKSDKKGKLAVDEKAAKVVRLIFDMKVKGKSNRQIAKYLNENNIDTPSCYLHIKKVEDKKNASIWKTSTINRILCNQVYLGHCIRGKSQKLSYKNKARTYIRREDCIINENTHEAIIDKETFKKVHTSKYGGVIKQNQINVTLRDLIYCDNCGCRMGIRKNRNDTFKIYCTKNCESEIICSNSVKIDYDYLECNVINQIIKYYNEHINFNLFKDKVLKVYINLKKKECNERKKQLLKKLNEIKFNILKIYNDRLCENISENQYKIKYEELVSERNKLNNDLEGENKKISDMQDRILILEDINNILDRFNQKIFWKKDIKKLIKKVRINNENLIIDYTFSNF